MLKEESSTFLLFKCNSRYGKQPTLAGKGKLQRNTREEKREGKKVRENEDRAREGVKQPHKGAHYVTVRCV